MEKPWGAAVITAIALVCLAAVIVVEADLLTTTSSDSSTVKYAPDVAHLYGIVTAIDTPKNLSPVTTTADRVTITPDNNVLVVSSATSANSTPSTTTVTIPPGEYRVDCDAPTSAVASSTDTTLLSWSTVVTTALQSMRSPPNGIVSSQLRMTLQPSSTGCLAIFEYTAPLGGNGKQVISIGGGATTCIAPLGMPAKMPVRLRVLPNNVGAKGSASTAIRTTHTPAAGASRSCFLPDGSKEGQEWYTLPSKEACEKIADSDQRAACATHVTEMETRCTNTAGATIQTTRTSTGAPKVQNVTIAYTGPGTLALTSAIRIDASNNTLAYTQGSDSSTVKTVQIPVGDYTSVDQLQAAANTALRAAKLPVRLTNLCTDPQCRTPQAAHVCSDAPVDSSDTTLPGLIFVLCDGSDSSVTFGEAGHTCWEPLGMVSPQKLRIDRRGTATDDGDDESGTHLRVPAVLTKANVPSSWQYTPQGLERHKVELTRDVPNSSNANLTTMSISARAVSDLQLRVGDIVPLFFPGTPCSDNRLDASCTVSGTCTGGTITDPDPSSNVVVRCDEQSTPSSCAAQQIQGKAVCSWKPASCVVPPDGKASSATDAASPSTSSVLAPGTQQTCSQGNWTSTPGTCSGSPGSQCEAQDNNKDCYSLHGGPNKSAAFPPCTWMSGIPQNLPVLATQATVHKKVSTVGWAVLGGAIVIDVCILVYVYKKPS